MSLGLQNLFCVSHSFSGEKIGKYKDVVPKESVMESGNYEVKRQGSAEIGEGNVAYIMTIERTWYSYSLLVAKP